MSERLADKVTELYQKHLDREPEDWEMNRHLYQFNNLSSFAEIEYKIKLPILNH